MAGAARSRAEDIPKGPKRKLNLIDRHVVKGMLARGDRISDVAYWFGVSPSTVHGIKKASAKYAWTMLDATTQLPPRGPYQLVQRAELVTLTAQRDAAAAVVRELEALLLKYQAAA